jgi:DNA-binding XRE family transcriptional regulator
MENIKTAFQENIKYIRQSYGLTQKEMANKLNIPIKSYQSYGEGRSEPNSTVILGICCITNVDFETMFKANMANDYTHIQILQKYVNKEY